MQSSLHCLLVSPGQHSKLTANTAVLSILAPLGVLQDAVVLALSFDMSLASATANRPEDEPALKRSLWLTIARHIVHQHPSQDQVSRSCACTTCASYLLNKFLYVFSCPMRNADVACFPWMAAYLFTSPTSPVCLSPSTVASGLATDTDVQLSESYESAE